MLKEQWFPACGMWRWRTFWCKSKSAVGSRLAMSLKPLRCCLDFMSASMTRIPARAWREILSLARAEGLTAYDASYLELAIRLGLSLATKDRALARAAKRAGVVVLP